MGQQVPVVHEAVVAARVVPIEQRHHVHVRAARRIEQSPWRWVRDERRGVREEPPEGHPWGGRGQGEGGDVRRERPPVAD